MNKAYGIIVNGTFYSGRMNRRLCSRAPNGIYSMNMEADDFTSTLELADIQEAVRYFRKASRTDVVRGVGFKDGMVPENPVAFGQVPIGVIDATFDDFDEVEAVRFGKEGLFYFLQTVETQKAYAIADIRAALDQKKPGKIEEIKGVTPEVRIAYALVVAERRKREIEEPVAALKAMMEETGAKVSKIKTTNRGYEVSWGFDRYNFVTIFDKNLRVVHAGYCVRGNDRVLSPTSIVNYLKDGIDQHGHDDGMIHTTVAYEGGDEEENDED